MRDEVSHLCHTAYGASAARLRSYGTTAPGEPGPPTPFGLRCASGAKVLARPAGLEPLLALAGPHPRSRASLALLAARSRRRSPLGVPLGSQACLRAGRWTPSERAERVSHANGARRRSGARERVLGGPAGRSPRLSKARPAGLEPATLGLEGCVPLSEAAGSSIGCESCHAEVPRVCRAPCRLGDAEPDE
jgi:hypothetical protein